MGIFVIVYVVNILNLPCYSLWLVCCLYMCLCRDPVPEVVVSTPVSTSSSEESPSTYTAPVVSEGRFTSYLASLASVAVTTSHLAACTTSTYVLSCFKL